MKRTWTIIGVSDVPGSLKWYQSLFDHPEAPPGHDHFGQILDTIFALLERCVGAELGTPGPIVHELEAIAGYEMGLRDSVERLPSRLGVWMVNRILNSTARASWMHLLELASRHPRADEGVLEDARDFLAHQKKRGD